MKTTSLLAQFRACRPNTHLLRIRQTPSSRPQLRYNRPQGEQRRQGYVRAEDPNFVSIVDHPPRLVRAGRRHGPGLIVLALIPAIAFGLGTWQVFRLGWKTELLAILEDRLIRPPLPLPPRIDPTAIKDFDYRRVHARGWFLHDKEMLIGPRIRDGQNGYFVVTPLERKGGASMVLVNRGWVPKKFKRKEDRSKEALPQGEVMVEGLLREPWTKNFFTPDNNPEKGEFYFPDVEQMAQVSGSEAVWVEETMGELGGIFPSGFKREKYEYEKLICAYAEPNLFAVYDREAKGIPIGRAPEVGLRNNHAQYIVTWYALSAATSIMLWMVVRKPPSDIARRVRQNKEW